MEKEELKQEEGSNEQPKAPETDLFGVPLETPEPKVEEKADDKEVKDKGKEDTKELDIENHPFVQTLRKEVENIKSEYGASLSGQRTVIKNLEKKIAELQSGKSPADGKQEGVPFKDIKRSKDLTKDERDAMTEVELR
jgi:hypothetical protein